MRHCGYKQEHKKAFLLWSSYFSEGDRIVNNKNFNTIFYRVLWQPTPVFLPGKYHGQRNLLGYSPWGCKESDRTEQLYFHFHRSRDKNLYLFWRNRWGKKGSLYKTSQKLNVHDKRKCIHLRPINDESIIQEIYAVKLISSPPVI